MTLPVEDMAARAKANLNEIEVPKSLIGGEYAALERTEIIETLENEHLLAFGSSGPQGRICLDMGTGVVVQVPVLWRPERREVNANLELFSRCVETVIARFPFYEIDDDDDVASEVSVGLRRELAAIDAVTDSLHGFWETFFDDLGMGVYSTEEVLGLLA